MFKSLRKKASVLSLSSSVSVDTVSSSGSINTYEQVLEQVKDFEIALQAMDYLLDDRSETGTELLKKNSGPKPSGQPCSIFDLALGVMEFIEATLGFEPEAMARAHQTLSDAETASLNNGKYNVRHNLTTSHIYPPGTEFQVTYAESTLLNALLMLLTENNGVLEGAKALFKLRRAYQTLDAVYNKVKEQEDKFRRNLSRQQKEASSNSLNLSSTDLPGYKLDEKSIYSSSASGSASSLVDKMERLYQMRKARFDGTSLGKEPKKEGSILGGSTSGGSIGFTRESSIDSSNDGRSVPVRKSSSLRNEVNEDAPTDSDSEEFADALSHQEEKEVDLPDPQIDICVTDMDSLTLNAANGSFVSSLTSQSLPDHVHVSTIDEFIHSGVQLCFGILQVVLSLIPPAIGKVLSIVGFRGNKEKGLKMLWRTAITSRNIHGELALLSLLVFYDGPIQFIDLSFQFPGNEDHHVKNVINTEGKATVSDAELDTILANPALYTPQILLKARQIFPHNALWVLQEGRILAAQGRLFDAINVMQSFTDDPANKIQMQQIEALLIFDRATFYVFAHDFDNAARDFIYLIDINSWSKAVYLFMAASCYLAKYRMIKMDMVKCDDKPAELARYAALAKKYYDLAPTYVPGHGANAKKGGIGGANKQMPFDKFLLRKLKIFTDTHKKHPSLSFVDCIGTSPIHELLYFWNGYNRMPQEQLEMSVRLLGFSAKAAAPYSENTSEKSYAAIEETLDEQMIRCMLQAVALRQLGKIAEGLVLLDEQVVDKYVISSQPQFRFHKMTYSPYLYPTALHERAIFVWELRTTTPGEKDFKQIIGETENWIKKAETVGEGDYELSNRTGLRIKAALDRLEAMKKQATHYERSE